MQTDPIGQTGGLNIYRYCANDPVYKLDASGKDLTDMQAIVKHSYDLGDSDFAWAFDSTGQASYDDVTGTYVATYTRTENLLYSYNPESTTVIGLMWGFGGNSQNPGCSNNQIVQLANRLAEEGISVVVGDWTQGDAITQYLEDAYADGETDVRVGGYSLGGPAAINVATNLQNVGISVAQLDTIDPVLLFGGTLSVPDNVQSAANRYQSNGGVQGITPGSIGNFQGTPVDGAIPNFDVTSIIPNVNHQNMPFVDQVYGQTLVDMGGHN